MAIEEQYSDICPNVTADYVKSLIAPNETQLTDEQIEDRINLAGALVLPIYGDLNDCGGTDTFCKILGLVSAHFVAMTERQTKSENIAGEWSTTYGTEFGDGLEGSTYGQMALLLDCSGKLAQADKKLVSVTLWSLGRDDNGDIEYNG